MDLIWQILSWRGILDFFGGGHIVVEFSGYVWHRWVEHRAYFFIRHLGKRFQWMHKQHHIYEYPPTDLHRKGSPVYYVGTERWSWYVLVVIDIILILAGTMLYYRSLAFEHSVPIIAGSLTYGWIMGKFHEVYHVKRHWLTRLWIIRWYTPKLLRLHAIHHMVKGNYGIIFFWMVWLCGTLVSRLPEGFRLKSNHETEMEIFS